MSIDKLIEQSLSKIVTLFQSWCSDAVKPYDRGMICCMYMRGECVCLLHCAWGLSSVRIPPSSLCPGRKSQDRGALGPGAWEDTGRSLHPLVSHSNSSVRTRAGATCTHIHTVVHKNTLLHEDTTTHTRTHTVGEVTITYFSGFQQDLSLLLVLPLLLDSLQLLEEAKLRANVCRLLVALIILTRR